MDMQNVSNLVIPEGEVRTIHDKDSRLIWGRLNYDTKYTGDTYQQTYSGWQMLGGDGMATPFSDTTYWSTTSGFTQTPLQNGWARLSNTSGSSMQFANCFIKTQVQFQASSTYTVVIELTNVEAGPRRLAFAAPASSSDSVDSYQFISCPDGVTEQTDGAVWYRSSGLVAGEYVLSFTTKNDLLTYLPRMYFMYPVDGKSFDMRMSIIQGNHSYDWQNYCGNNWQPFVGGGIPAPSPDFPEPIQVVTGEQTVAISGEDQSQEYEINLGKNLFDKATATVLSGAVNSDLTYTSGGNARTVFIPCEPNTKYSASKITQGSRSRLGSCTGRIDTDGGSLTYYTQAYNDVNSRRILELTTGPNDKYLYFTFGQTSDAATIQDLVDSIQIEVGDVTPYAPYFTPIELCKIGDYQDYIYKSGSDWYVHKEVGKYTLTGQEGWRLNSGTGCFYDSGNSYLANGGKVPADNGTLPNIVSSHFAEGTYQRIWSNATQDGIAVAADGTSNPRIRVTGITTLTSFKDMITAKQPVLYFPLATATDTKITDATLVGQLNAVHEWLTRYGYNSTVTGNLPIIIDRTNL